MAAYRVILAVVLTVIHCQAIAPPDYSPNIFRPIYTRKDPRKYGYGLNNVFQLPYSKECRYKSFGLNDAKIPLWKTSFRYSYSRPPFVTYKVGDMDKKTAETLSQVFKGLLMPRVQASASRGPPQHDYDMCCPTVHGLKEAPYQQMDEYGVYQDIIHIPSHDIYQYYHAGKCLDSDEENFCHGSCIQATATVFLAVFRFDLDVGFSFAPFTVHSYCSCRNIGRSLQRVFNGTQQREREMEVNKTEGVAENGVSRKGQTEKRALDTSSQSTKVEVLETSPQTTAEDKKQPF